MGARGADGGRDEHGCDARAHDGCQLPLGTHFRSLWAGGDEGEMRRPGASAGSLAQPLLTVGASSRLYVVFV